MAYEAPNLRMWLMQKLGRDDAIGALARAIRRDMDAGWKPSKLTPGVLRLHLQRIGAGESVLSVAQQAAEQWRAHVRAIESGTGESKPD